MSDVLRELRPRSPRWLVEELAELGRKLAAADRARPEVELGLASGQIVRGRIVATADERDGATIVLVHVAGPPTAPTIAHVRTDQIVVVTIADASVLVRGVTSDRPVPSRLELARRAAARSDGLESALGHPVSLSVASDLDDDGRRAVGELVELLGDVLARIAGDDMGRHALAPITAIELTAASYASVERRGGTLVIAAARLPSDALDATTLRELIEKRL